MSQRPEKMSTPKKKETACNALSWNDLASEFKSLVGIDPPDDLRFKRIIESTLDGLVGVNPVSANERKVRLFALINSKFGINSAILKEILSAAARDKVFFNYHDKIRVEAALDRADYVAYKEILRKKNALIPSIF